MTVSYRSLSSGNIDEIICDDYSINNEIMYFYTRNKLVATIPFKNFIILIKYDLQ